MKTDVQKDVDRILTEDRQVVGEAIDHGIAGVELLELAPQRAAINQQRRLVAADALG